jgi:hypothetical protein
MLDSNKLFVLRPVADMSSREGKEGVGIRRDKGRRVFHPTGTLSSTLKYWRIVGCPPPPFAEGLIYCKYKFSSVKI